MHAYPYSFTRHWGDLRAYLPVTPRKGRTEGGYSGGGHGYAPTTPTPKNASPRAAWWKLALYGEKMWKLNKIE